MTLQVQRACSLTNCVGCAQLSTQLLCYSAQQVCVAVYFFLVHSLHHPPLTHPTRPSAR